MPRDKNYTVIKRRYGKASKKSARWAKRVRILDIRRDVNLVYDDTGIFRKILAQQRINGTIQCECKGRSQWHLFQHSHTSRIAVMESWS